MLVTKDRAVPHLSCDRCGAVFGVPDTGLDAAVVLAAATARGWREERLGGVPWHRCPACGPVGGVRSA